MNRLDEARRTVVIDMSHLSMLSLFAGWLQFRPTVTLCHLTKKPPPTVFFRHDFCWEPGGRSARFGTPGRVIPLDRT